MFLNRLCSDFLHAKGILCWFLLNVGCHANSSMEDECTKNGIFLPGGMDKRDD